MEFYEIRIRGHLDNRRAAGFAGLTLVLLPNGETRLSGAVADQAALYAILTRIRDLGMPLLFLERKPGAESGKHSLRIDEEV